MAITSHWLLAKIRHYVEPSTLVMIYHGIFSSLMQYSSQIWGQDWTIASKVEKIQNKAIRIMNFEEFSAPVNPLYHKLNIPKFSDSVKILNFLFAHNTLRGNLPKALCDRQTFTDIHYEHRHKSTVTVKVPKIRTITSGSNSIKYKAAKVWNEFVLKFKKNNFFQDHRSICKSFLIDYYISTYQ